jgi:phage-related protein
MKLSKLMHVLSIIAGLAGIIYFAAAGYLVLNGVGKYIFGVTKIDALLCIAILFLVAIWFQIAAIHHMMLEKRGELI